MLMTIELIKLLNIKNNTIEVRPSPIHGNGIFATKKINNGQIITFYDLHCIRLYHGKNNDYIQSYVFENPKNTNGIQFEASDDYEIIVNNHISIFNDPTYYVNSVFLGHIVNDSTSLLIKDKKLSYIEFRNKIMRYFLQSNNNAMIKCNDDNSLRYIVAIRDIEINEEILVSYSPNYWLQYSKLLNKYKYLIMNDPSINIFF